MQHNKAVLHLKQLETWDSEPFSLLSFISTESPEHKLWDNAYFAIFNLKYNIGQKMKRARQISEQRTDGWFGMETKMLAYIHHSYSEICAYGAYQMDAWIK